MSSSPPTEEATARPARWRSPAGWSLRARLVAIIIALLAVLGLVVGATAEVYLRATLYNQVDAQLDEFAQRSMNGPGQGGGRWFQAPPPGAQSGSITLYLASTSGATVAGGGLVQYRGTDTEDTQGPPNVYQPLNARQLTTPARLAPNGEHADIGLDGLGDYRVVSTMTG